MLLPHNIPVYNQLNQVLLNNNEACVIMGTGVGKSYVTNEYISQNNFRALIVSPRHSINNAWLKLCGDKIDVITYQKLANIYQTIDFSKYNVVICDECHHLGAPKWGTPIRYIIDNQLTKVVGLTENSIRYTDGCRDIGKEFFNSNFCYGESVETAIRKKVLNPVKYISALFNTEGLRENLRGRITEKLYSKLDLALNNTPTVREIIEKNMPQTNKKGIIFASTIQEIPEAIKIVKEIYPDLQFRKVHSKQSNLLNQRNIDWFNSAEEGFLCSVDMLSEGVHLSGVSVLFMFRRTESPSVFSQQLGRCLSASNQNTAVVFDLVNNKSNIKISSNGVNIRIPSIFDGSMENGKASEQIIIKDTTRDVVEVLKEIKDYLNGSFSDEEINYIKENYLALGPQPIAQKLNRTVGVIRNKARALGLCMKKMGWTEEEIAIIKQYYPSEGVKVLKRLPPNVKKDSLIHFAQKLGIRWIQGKKVRCVETGVIYETTYAAAKAICPENYRTAVNKIWRCCSGRRNKTLGYHWEYVD